MSLMNDGWIRANAGSLFDDFDENRLQPASYDLTLSKTILMPGRGLIDTLAMDKNSVKYENRTAPLVLTPGEFVLGSTREMVRLPNDIGARFEGKSTLGRMGLATHVTAGFIDPGFHGALTVEIKNMSFSASIVLRPGMPIGQICFYSMNEPAIHPYGGTNGNHYSGQFGPKKPYFLD